MTTLAASPSCLVTLTISRRRSSESGGIGTRMAVPIDCGLTPRSESRMAFSTTTAMDFSQTLTSSVRASASEMLATWLMGVEVP